MRKTNKKWFTMVELIIVITIISILGWVWYLSLQGNIDDSTYSNDNTLYNQARQEVDRLFVKDYGIDWTTNTDHKIRFNQNQGSFDVWTIDSSDSSDLTYAEAWQIFADVFAPKLWLSASEFDVQVCDRDATNANIDAVLNTKTTGRYYELLVFTDATATLTDCTWTITAWTTQIAGYTFRYKNAKLDWNSDNYDSDKKTDGWARISATALNAAWENTIWAFKPITSTLSVTNNGY